MFIFVGFKKWVLGYLSVLSISYVLAFTGAKSRYCRYVTQLMLLHLNYLNVKSTVTVIVASYVYPNYIVFVLKKLMVGTQLSIFVLKLGNGNMEFCEEVFHHWAQRLY